VWTEGGDSRGEERTRKRGKADANAGQGSQCGASDGHRGGLVEVAGGAGLAPQAQGRPIQAERGQGAPCRDKSGQGGEPA
jgi:hypothetical protein